MYVINKKHDETDDERARVRTYLRTNTFFIGCLLLDWSDDGMMHVILLTYYLRNNYQM